MTKYIGLSFSSCVTDIAQGVIDFDSVKKIIAATCSEDPEYLIEMYAKSPWGMRSNLQVDKAVEIGRRLFAEGKVDQPRLRDEPAPNIQDGYWVDAETGHVLSREYVESLRAKRVKEASKPKL